jgi:hypothetical protein
MLPCDAEESYQTEIAVKVVQLVPIGMIKPIKAKTNPVALL